MPPTGYNEDGTKIADPNNDSGFNAGNSGGGGGGGSIGGGSIGGGSGSGGGMGWGGLSWGITFTPSTSGKHGSIEIGALEGEFVKDAQQ